MRWTCVQVGDVRTRTRFCLFPKFLRPHVYWLQRVTTVQEFGPACDGHLDLGRFTGWHDVEVVPNP